MWRRMAANNLPFFLQSAQNLLSGCCNNDFNIFVFRSLVALSAVRRCRVLISLGVFFQALGWSTIPNFVLYGILTQLQSARVSQ